MNASEIRADIERWLREAGIEKIVGHGTFRLSEPPVSLLKSATQENELIVVQPAHCTAAQLSDVFKLMNWAAVGLDTVSEAPVQKDLWFVTPASDVPPYLGETPVGVAKIAASAGKKGMSLEQYLVFAARFRAIHGRFPDVNYWTWLLESREQSLLLFAGFDSHGNIQINSCTPDYRDENTGCRLITVNGQ